MTTVSNLQEEIQSPPLAQPLKQQLWGGVKLLVLLVAAALILLLVGCKTAGAAEEGETVLPAADGAGDGAALPGDSPAAEPATGAEEADEATPRFAMVAGTRRQKNSLDVMFGVQGSAESTINVPTATEKWKVSGGGVSWLGYRRDIGDGLFSFGGRVGLRGTGLTQENSTTMLDYHHVIQSVFLLPTVRLSLPLGSHKAVWFVDTGAGIGFHSFILDEDAPNGTPKPQVQDGFAFSVLSGFMFCVYDGDARLDIGFNVDVLGAQARIKKLYPAGTPADDKFKKFNLGHAGLDFNLAVKF